VLKVPAGNPSRIASLEDALARGLELVLPRDAAAYEARRLAAGRGDRVREAASPGELRSAPVALVPLSWAGTGERVPVDLRPIEVRATVLTGSKQAAAARAFVSFLASETGQRAFATCGNTR
jgi:accessory colonization factor AcfC